jgi:S-formylglutathione hydrolase
LPVDYGDADPFLAEQLRPELLQGACEKANIPLKLRRQPCYDHSYYFTPRSWVIIGAGMPRV